MIYISIGSNSGNRLLYLDQAVSLLRERYFPDLITSIILETASILPPNAPASWDKPFLNMIVVGNSTDNSAGNTNLSPHGLLRGLKEIEYEIGRPQQYQKWEPRVIDLDILLWDDIVLATPDLSIPHQELKNRPFLLHLLAMMGVDNLPALSPDTKNKTGRNGTIFFKSFVLEPKLVGIVNVTSDSFSDGGLYYEPEQAINHINRLIAEGAGVIDIGAQSTRPGATIQTPSAEYQHLKPVLDEIKYLRLEQEVIISIDSFQPEVIARILDNYQIGWINDVTGKLSEETLRLIAQSGCSIVWMHALTVPPQPEFTIPIEADPITIIKEQALAKINQLLNLGFSRDRIIIDPGIGFGKTGYQNLRILQQAGELKKALNIKILIGHSRKSFINNFITSPPQDRDLETIAVSGYLADKVDFLRVHNVCDHRRFLVARHSVKG